MPGPLTGCRVIELAHIMAGPVAGLMRADMGADVIKIEKANGDDSRRMTPPSIEGESAAFMMMNRNKRGMVLDLKSEAGKDIFKRLIQDADVVIENYRKGTMEKLGLGYEELRKINPGLIYLEISGFGRTGPLSDQGGFDLVAQGMSGLMSITGQGGHHEPVKVGAPVTDITAGILGAMGVSAAYAHKLKTGKGQRIDTSLYEAGITHTYWQSAIAFATGETPEALGSAHPLNAPYQAFATQNGWINIGAANQNNWEKLCQVLEVEFLLEDERFGSNEARMRNLSELVTVLNSTFSKNSTEHWLQELESAGVPAGPLLSIPEMHRHPQTLARNMVVESQHSKAGKVKGIGNPVKFSDTQSESHKAAPTLGEDTEEILVELGYSPEAIQSLKDSNVVS